MGILRRLANYAIYGGSWEVRPYEREIIEAVAKSLAEPDGEILQLQLKFLDYIKRLHQDRMVTFCFETSEESFRYLRNADPARPIAKVFVRSSQGNFTVHVVAHRGRLFSLEFTKSPTHLKNEKLIIRKIETVNISPSNVPEEIDREEHADPSAN